jgi:translation initiation factor 3 subunit I
MKPLLLQGHSRPIRFIKFNEIGDILYTASADRTIMSWNSLTGEKLKVYNHSAAVNTFTLTSNGQYLISGDNTGTIYIWDIKTGMVNRKIENANLQSVRSLDLGTSDSLLMVVYAAMRKNGESSITVYKMNDLIDKTPYEKDSIYVIDKQPISNEQLTPFKYIPCSSNTKFSNARFVHDAKNILVSRDDGVMQFINCSNDKTITEYKFHDDNILDFDVEHDKGIVITAGKDGKSFVFNIDTFEIINKFIPNNPLRNLNTCRLFSKAKKEESKPTSKTDNNPFDFNKIFNLNIDDLFNSGVKKDNDWIAIIAGGQDSKLVTTTHAKEGGFELMGYDIYKGDNIFSLQAHFGPVNALDCSKGKRLFASGSEDSGVKIFSLDNIDQYS